MSHGMTVRSTRTVLAPSKYGVQYKYEYAMTKSGTKGVRSVLRGNTYLYLEVKSPFLFRDEHIVITILRNAILP